MPTRIYVGNLPYSATNERLAQLFAAYGEVSEATIVMDRDSGRSKGFGFVQMSDDTAARTAIGALDGTTLDDRAIRVSEAKARLEPSGDSRPRRSFERRGPRW
jgi:cold-inducible RNA-binding protein